MSNYHSAKSFFFKRKKKEAIPRKKNKFAIYNYGLIGIMTIPVFSVGLFNWLIDPQDIFKSPNYWKINHEKIKKDNNDRLFKAIDVIRLQPEAIIVGSSRTKQGINPDSLPIANRDRAYNLAINGPNFYEVRRYIEHAIYNQPDLEQIILGLDFFMFNQELGNQPTFKNSRLEKKRIIFDDLVQNLFSIDVLNKSLDTIEASKNSPDTVNEDYGDDGFMPNRNFNNGETIWRFNQSIKLYFDLHSEYQFSESYWNDFKQIVQLCRENNIELKVFISPAHATQWESIYTTKRWDVFEQWKRELVKIVPVWDFSGYHSISTEAISVQMTHYVDSSHYSQKVGNLILNRIFSYELETIPPDFGVLITPENIESHLANIRLQKENWRNNNQEEVRLVEKIKSQIKQ